MRFTRRVLLMVALLMNSFSFADSPVRLIEIKSEQYANETYYLGYMENADHSISRVFYENNEHEYRLFSFEELNRPVPIIQAKSGGTIYDLVRISARPEPGRDSKIIDMSYMKNGLFKNRVSISFRLKFNPNLQRFELRDSSSDRLITRAYVTTNYWGSMAVGIDQIQVSK